MNYNPLYSDFDYNETISDPTKPPTFESRKCTKCKQIKDNSHWTKSTLYKVYSSCRECK